MKSANWKNIANACTTCLALTLQISTTPAQAADYDIGSIHIAQPWARATPKGASSGAAYMTITNNGKTTPQRRKPNDLSRSLTALDMATTLIAVVELSLSSWLVAGIVPGVERQPLKKLKTDESALLALPNRWRDEAVRSGYKISRIAP
jgi:hypothetical protein